MALPLSVRLDRWAMSLFAEDPELLKLARRVTTATGAPVLGGIAVFLHGYRRTTEDIELYAADPAAVRTALEAIGARWVPEASELVLDGVSIQLVTDRETGGPPEVTEERQGVLVVSLADLVRTKLRAGLEDLNRARDVADVVELIRSVPLDKRFAARLPREQRSAFEKLVDAVRSARG
jgi:hypothetical protein